jgi:hypothetical protein
MLRYAPGGQEVFDEMGRIKSTPAIHAVAKDWAETGDDTLHWHSWLQASKLLEHVGQLAPGPQEMPGSWGWGRGRAAFPPVGSQPRSCLAGCLFVRGGGFSRAPRRGKLTDCPLPLGALHCTVQC